MFAKIHFKRHIEIYNLSNGKIGKILQSFEWCPDDLYFCKECRTVQYKYYIDNDKIVEKKICHTCCDYCYKHSISVPEWFNRVKVRNQIINLLSST